MTSNKEPVVVESVSMADGLFTTVKVILYICLIIILCQYLAILLEELPWSQ